MKPLSKGSHTKTDREQIDILKVLQTSSQKGPAWSQRKVPDFEKLFEKKIKSWISETENAGFHPRKQAERFLEKQILNKITGTFQNDQKGFFKKNKKTFKDSNPAARGQ